MSQNEYLLTVWVTITVLAVSGMVAALVWAIRSRQFGQQDHARSLALESGIPVAPPSPLGGVLGRAGEPPPSGLGGATRGEQLGDDHVLQ